MKIADLVMNRINRGWVLPSNQREFVWLRNPREKKIEKLFDSIHQEYPFGTILTWQVQKDSQADKIHWEVYQFAQHYDEDRPHNSQARMDNEELSSLIALGDAQTLEFKRSMPDDLGRELCADTNWFSIVFARGAVDGDTTQETTRETDLTTPITTPITTQETTQETSITTQETTQETIRVREKIVQFLKVSPSMTREDLASACGITSDGIKYHLARLQEAGKLRRVGSKKAGHWEVVD
jgi:hypothetical protein